VGKFVASIKRQKSQKCFSFRGFCPLPFWPGALPLDSAGACAPRPPFIGASQLHLEGLQLSSADTD